jgi:uncharacterized membrane-anchored protein
MIQRRTVLRGLGLCVALPLLEREANAAEVAAPMRMVCVANPLGFIPDVFFRKNRGVTMRRPLCFRRFLVKSSLCLAIWITVFQIATARPANQIGFRSLIEEIVLSESFRR